MFVLKTKELEKYLVVARCTEMCLRMHRVPRIFPIAKYQRKCSDRFQLLDKEPTLRLGNSVLLLQSTKQLRVRSRNDRRVPRGRTFFIERDCHLFALFCLLRACCVCC